ncbi:MAG: 23S rRNA (uracil(1939)-C(5))-methyltransferase RlmD [Tissierellia bacterium]|nr:23S rRNA (uracil(1939)-C(5))-methyltransferase RlmD [Tissierellia bacterium]
MKKKREIDLRIDRLIFPNLAEGLYNEKPIRLKGAIPGQLVRARLGKNKKNYKEAKLIQILERSDLETNEPCPNFEICGGCSYQTLKLETELELKKKSIEDLINGIGVEKNLIVHKNPKPYGYRNKMEYTFGDSVKDGPIVLGLHRRGRYYEIVDTVDCNIVHPDYEIIRTNLMNYFRNSNKMKYRKMSREGFLRHLVIRYALSTGEIMVNLVTTSQDELDEIEFTKLLLDLELEGNIVSILHTVNDDPADAVKSDFTKIIYGRDYIFEKVLGLDFKVSAFSFFQPNVFGIENLYSRVLELCGDIEDLTIFDLYSGTGTISQILAKSAKKVIGVEIVEEAVEAAKENAKLNKIENVEFRANDVLKELENLDSPPQLIVLDPPRSGIHPKALQGILEFKPEKFIYISCNPKSMAGDLNSFFEKGYKLENIEIFDQFTRTYHVETIAMMSRE